MTTRLQRKSLDTGAIDIWLFDLDNTLYPASSRLFAQIETRMNAFIQRFLMMEAEEAQALRRRYLEEHGSTLRGLMVNDALDPGEFLAYVHDIDVSLLAPSPALDGALAALPGRKIIFTNGSLRHAETIMARLGIRHHFDDVFDITAADYLPKPRPQCYDALVARHRIDPRRTVFFDDILRNLEPAARLGMTTVWVPGDGVPPAAESDFVDHVAEDLVAWLDDLAAAWRAAPAGAAGER